MKTSDQRLNNIIGQLEGVKKILINKNKDCFSLLVQLKAARSAISSLMEKIVEDELNHCLLVSPENNKDKIEKIFKEVIK